MLVQNKFGLKKIIVLKKIKGLEKINVLKKNLFEKFWGPKKFGASISQSLKVSESHSSYI